MNDTHIKDVLKDILRHTHGLGFFDMVRLIGTDADTTIETVNSDKSVILKARTHAPVPEFIGATVGLSRLGVLQGYTQYAEFDAEDASVRVIHQNRNDQRIPSEVEFVSANGTTAHYRFMLAEVINQQLKEIVFRGSNADVTFTPTTKMFKDLTVFNNILGQYEANFTPKLEQGKLYFYLGDNGGDRSRILIAENVVGKLNSNTSWPLDILLRILKLGDSESVVVNIDSRGLLEVTTSSAYGEYTYYVPGQ